MNKKTTSKIAFNSGEFVVYPAHGVGKVADISTQKIGGAELELIVVNFDKDKMTLRVPLSKAESVGLRKISETPVMDEALGVLKGKAKVRKIMWSRRAQEYENKINSGSPVAIAEVVRDLYRRENLSEQSYSERQIYEQALDRLANEYAICNNISAGDATKKLLDIPTLRRNDFPYGLYCGRLLAGRFFVWPKFPTGSGILVLLPPFKRRAPGRGLSFVCGEIRQGKDTADGKTPAGKYETGCGSGF